MRKKHLTTACYEGVRVCLCVCVRAHMSGGREKNRSGQLVISRSAGEGQVLLPAESASGRAPAQAEQRSEGEHRHGGLPLREERAVRRRPRTRSECRMM